MYSFTYTMPENLKSRSQQENRSKEVRCITFLRKTYTFSSSKTGNCNFINHLLQEFYQKTILKICVVFLRKKTAYISKKTLSLLLRKITF